MAIETDFLHKLIVYGEAKKSEEEPYFQVATIGNLDKSCCEQSKLVVYDFDKCKEIIAKKKDLTPPKSCDALKILPAEGKVFFIEMKSWQQIIKWQLKPNKDTSQVIEAQIERQDLGVKLHDSLMILGLIIQENAFDITKVEKRCYLSISKQMVLLVDINTEKISGAEKIAIDLALLGTISSTPETLAVKALNRKLNAIEKSGLANSGQIILKNCQNIDAFFDNRN